MATREKLFKAFEALKVFQPPAAIEDAVKKKEQALSSKERVIYYNTIADIICSSGMRTTQDFPKFLGMAIETFLMCCDDQEADVRMVADECLNRIIKTLLETNLGRLQVELYKEIKRNGAARSLRAALSRFADLCHLIRPQKCRPYVINMLPCLAGIAKRPEESVQETLAIALVKICAVLGKFTNDGEVKILLKAFLPNLKSPSPVLRRTSATSLTAICQFSRKPMLFFAWLLNSLLDLVIPVVEDRPVSVLLGTFLCLRHLIPHLAIGEPRDLSLKGSFGVRQREPEIRIGLDQLLQVYEVLLHYSHHDDHNVVTTVLETLQQLFRTPPPTLLNALLSPEGINHTRIFAADIQELGLFRAGSEIGSMPSLVDDDTGLEDDIYSSEVSSQTGSCSMDESPLGAAGDGDAPSSSPVLQREVEDATLDEACYISLDEENKSDYSNIHIARFREGNITPVGSIGTLSRSSPKRKARIRKGYNDDHGTEEGEDYFAWDPGTPSPSPGLSIKFQIGNVGSFTDADYPVVYCSRLLCSSFLLTGSKGGLMPDKNIRVSVKALALGCLSAIVSMKPSLFFLPLFKPDESDSGEDAQLITDVLLFYRHSDPQLRGTTAHLIGMLTKAALCESGGKFNSWVQKLTSKEEHAAVTMGHLMEILQKIMLDDSSVACRMALLSLRTCLNSVLHSEHSLHGMKILHELLQLPSHPYWLVKVELLELLVEIPFKTAYFLESSVMERNNSFIGIQVIHYEDHIFNEVLLILLGDEDSRVRQAAVTTITKIIPHLFYPVDHPQQDPIIALARSKTNSYLDPILHESSLPLHPMIHGLVQPYDTSKVKPPCATTEMALSRVVSLLVRTLVSSSSKYLTFGCCHALCALSEEYLVTVYPYAWTCGLSGIPSAKGLFRASSIKRPPLVASNSTEIKGSSSQNGGIGLASLIISLLTSTSVAIDLAAHQHALQLIGNLFAGMAFKVLQPKPEPSGESVPTEETPWNMLKDKQVALLAEQLLIHLMRLLNICSHVIEEQIPLPPPTKTALPSLPSAPSLSPIKRKSKIKDEASNANTNTNVKSSSGKAAQAVEKEEKAEKEKSFKTLSSTGFGSFQSQPHYLRLYDVLRSAYSSYKISLDIQTSEKFVGLLKTCLDATSQVLEIATMTEIGKHAEELLGYLKSTVSLEATATIRCVQQLLKALFGTNLSSLWEGPQHSSSSRKPGRATRLTATMTPGLYHCCFTAPYTQFMQSLSETASKVAAVSTGTQDSDDSSTSWLGWVRRKSEKKLASLFKTIGKGDKYALASYIRLFEPLVIKALKQYTITSSVVLQCQVLQLLAQLVQLRVNYCLLDSDQIFIGFVIKQFEFIEEGQIANADQLIAYIFHFLVLLSYERYHSKHIIAVPKIIQLCDGLMASGQPPTTYAIPALLPIVEDLFLMRGSMNKADVSKELDTQREVIVSMLFRLVHYHQVLEMFILILQQSHKEGEEKWKKLSRQIIDVLLPLLASQQIILDSQVALDVLHRLFEAVAPSVFRPVDVLLKILFAAPHDLSTLSNLQRWLCLVLAIFRVLIAQSKEEVVLGRLTELKLTINIFCDTLPVQLKLIKPATTIQTEPLPAEETIARFLLQIVGMISTEIQRRIVTSHTDFNDSSFICQQLAHLLLYIMYMFQSGIYRKVATVCMEIVKLDSPPGFFSVQTINKTFLELASIYPTLTLQWCNVLILLNFDDQNFWGEVMLTSLKRTGSGSRPCLDSGSSSPVHSCHLEMVRKGGLILFCDYVCENLTDAEHMTWLIINHVNELVQLSAEPPVQDLISAIHRNSAASGLFIQAIHARYENFSQPSFVKQTLGCLEAIHVSQSGALLTLLIDKFLATHHLAVARACDSMACRRIEMLLAEPPDEGAHELPEEDLDKLLEIMYSAGLVKRHSRLEMLLRKLQLYCFPETKLRRSDSSSLKPDYVFSVQSVKESVLDKDWYISIIKEQCFSSSPSGTECAHLLSKLEYEDVLTILLAKEFNLNILEECLSFGIQISLCAYMKDNKGSPCESPLPVSPPPVGPESPLQRAATLTLLRHIANIVELMPRPHQVFLTADHLTPSPKEAKYHNRLIDLFSSSTLWDVLFQIIPVLTRYLKNLSVLPWHAEVPPESLGDLGRFCIVILEALHWLVEKETKPNPLQLQQALHAIYALLRNQSIAGVIGLRDHTTWVCSAIASVHRVMNFVLQEESLPKLSNSGIGRIIMESDQQRAAQACDQAAELVLWLELCNHQQHNIPLFLEKYLKNIIVGLARLPPVDSYVRTPPVVWQMGWSPELTGNPQTTVPPLPIEYLQERDVLKQFIFRVNTLGWTSRQQFEETWMALLGVLSATPMGDVSNPEEELERVQTSCLAVKCITALLLQTLLLPQPGNPQNSSFLQQQRDKPLAFLHTRCGKKLYTIRNIVHQKLQSMLLLQSTDQDLKLKGQGLYETNLERKLASYSYGYTQVALEYLWTATGMLDEMESEDVSTPGCSLGSVVFHQRKECLTASNLDIHSCLHFLLDLYSQWMASSTSSRIPLTLLTEAARSVVQLSDIFMNRTQFEWMLDTFLELHRIHPAEDEIIAQYLILGICKAAAVLGFDMEMADRLKKLLELSLRSTHLPTRLATLYSLLYLLEQGSSEETLLFLSVAIEYIIKHLDGNLCPNNQSEEHALTIWTLTFYIMENYHDDLHDTEFVPKVLQLCIQVASAPEDTFPLSIYLIILHGLERLLLAEVIAGKDAELLVKLSVDRFYQQNPIRALASLGLMLSCMYAGKESDKWSPTAVTSGVELPDPHSSNQQPTDPESLIVAMERVTVLFDRIKKGYPFEAETISAILPLFLTDFFPPSDIMNKVIGEFISNQQPHPQLLASVVFQVFESVYLQSQQPLIQEWVMLSLSNFTQRSPVSMAVWSLTCFFISASTNCWIRALFPHMQRRMGKMEATDKKLFCLSALDFRNQLMDEAQRRIFYTTFASVAEPDTPYADLLACL